ncbi:MAG TPA: 4-alpha-glucanotransferase [Burkholderiales bacterium]|nr:4-alpha-glucanotransferase [Burkholderiales bacterium]
MNGKGDIRQAGILLHPSSLPSGRLDGDAERWLDWLAGAGMSVWQMLPLGVPLAGISPYQCASAFALNPLLFPEKLPAIRLTDTAFKLWYRRQRHWIDNYALFMVIKQHHEFMPWMEWPEPLRRRDPETLLKFGRKYRTQINNHIRHQYQLYAYWQNLRLYAGKKQIALFGDMPLFVAHDSADVWSHPDYFLLDASGQPTLVAGVPPDYFSATGQRWGNPQYNWEYMQQTDFVWWRDRLRYHFEFFDLVRIDHFRGLSSSWMIPASCPTAIEGSWRKVPGEALMQRIHDEMGTVPLVAEDLGLITEEVVALRKRFHLPGMSVLQFAFDGYADNPHKPQNVTLDKIYYTGTHDNNTVKGWFSELDNGQQSHVLSTLSIPDASNLTPAMIDTVLNSHAELAIIPLQDILDLDGTARMNTPGTVEGNWLWRFSWTDLPDSIAACLYRQLQRSERLKI